MALQAWCQDNRQRAPHYVYAGGCKGRALRGPMWSSDAIGTLQLLLSARILWGLPYSLQGALRCATVPFFAAALLSATAIHLLLCLWLLPQASTMMGMYCTSG